MPKAKHRKKSNARRLVARAATVSATTGAAGVLALLLSPGTAAAERGDGRYGPGEFWQSQNHRVAVDRGYPVARTLGNAGVECLPRTPARPNPCAPPQRHIGDSDRGERATGVESPGAVDRPDTTPGRAPGNHQPDQRAAEPAARTQAPGRTSESAPARSETKPGARHQEIGVGPDDRAPGGKQHAEDRTDPRDNKAGVDSGDNRVGVGPADRAPAEKHRADERTGTGALAQRDTDGDGYSDGSLHESPEVGRRDGMHPSGTAAGPDDQDNDGTHDAGDMVDGRDDDGDGTRNDLDARPGPDFDDNANGVMDGWEKSPDDGGHQLADPVGSFHGASARVGFVEVTAGINAQGQKHGSVGIGIGTKAPEIGSYTPDPNGVNAKVGASYTTPKGVVGGGISANVSPAGQISGTGFVEGGVITGGWTLGGGVSVTCGGGGCAVDGYTGGLRSLDFAKPGGKTGLDFGAGVNVSGTFDPPGTGGRTQARGHSGLDGNDPTGASSGRGSMSDENADRGGSSDRSGSSVGGSRGGLDGHDSTGAASGRGSMSDENADRDSSGSTSGNTSGGGLDGNDPTGASSGRGSMSDENADRY